MKSFLALTLLSLAFTIFAQEAKSKTEELLEGTKAKFNCTFKKSAKSDLVSLKLKVDLEKATAEADVDWGADNEVSKLSLLTFSRASSDTDKKTLTKFAAYESWGKNYLAPNTLVIAGNNGDDTDQTIVIQYRPRAETKEELLANRKRGESDYIDINLTYIQSVDGYSHPNVTSCTMEVAD